MKSDKSSTIFHAINQLNKRKINCKNWSYVITPFILYLRMLTHILSRTIKLIIF